MKEVCPICNKEIPLSSFLKHVAKHGSGGNKFHAVMPEADGITFRSGLERDRYLQLRMLEEQGVISDLELQPKFPCVVNKKLITTYTADFRYIENGKTVIEDTKGTSKSGKGTKTDGYVVRRKLAEALYGIKVVEVTREMM